MPRERPLSPHLQVYKPQITSILSITHRATGTFLLIGMFVLVWYLMETAFWSPTYHCISDFLKTTFGFVLLIGWAFSLYYHLLNGIRHLFWDAGLGFKLDQVTKSGIAVILGAIALTAATVITISLITTAKWCPVTN